MNRLFLDDYRIPEDCIPYMYKRIGAENTIYLKYWDIVRNYPEFVNYLENNKLPDIISFDHDLADGLYHKNLQKDKLNYESIDFESDDYNKTGYHCAKFLINFCLESKQKLPEFIVHSLNPVGTENIINLLTNKQLYGS